MIETIQIVGARGRVGSALSARLAERGIALDSRQPELVVLCVPDRAIAEVASATPLGPWIAHVSGATPLDALDPHLRRFGLHPLQSFSKARGAEQLDGAWGAVTAETDEARRVGRWLAETLGLRPFDLDDDRRAAYHAGAAMASNYLVTLRAAAGSLLEAAGRAARGSRSSHPWRHGYGLRADRADRAWRLGDRRAAPRRDPHRATRARGAVPRARGGDRPHRWPRAPK